jgi:hypothetical protein
MLQPVHHRPQFMKLGIASVGVNIRQIQPCTSQLVQTGVAVEKTRYL